MSCKAIFCGLKLVWLFSWLFKTVTTFSALWKWLFLGSYCGWLFSEHLKRKIWNVSTLEQVCVGAHIHFWCHPGTFFSPQTRKLPAKRKFLFLNHARTWYRLFLQAEYVLFTDWWPLRVSEVWPHALWMVISNILLRMDLSLFWIFGGGGGGTQHKESIHSKLGDWFPSVTVTNGFVFNQQNICFYN